MLAHLFDKCSQVRSWSEFKVSIIDLSVCINEGFVEIEDEIFGLKELVFGIKWI